MSIEEKIEILRVGQDTLLDALQSIRDDLYNLIQRMDEIEDEFTCGANRPH
jgi:prefoldin subunit 5